MYTVFFFSIFFFFSNENYFRCDKTRETSGKTFPSTFALRKPLLIEEIKGLGVFTTLKKSIFTENSN